MGRSKTNVPLPFTGVIRKSSKSADPERIRKYQKKYYKKTKEAEAEARRKREEVKKDSNYRELKNGDDDTHEVEYYLFKKEYDGVKFYFVKWRGYDGYNWEPEDKFVELDHLVHMQRYFTLRKEMKDDAEKSFQKLINSNNN